MSLIEKAQANLDEEKAKEMEQKFRKNTFGFDDYLESMNQMKNMGRFIQRTQYASGNRLSS